MSTAPGMVRVRFAPSPTGNLHIGGARTALFNWLFARHHGGVFILRIEDTDRERSRPEFTEEIIESMGWMGLCHDEGPYFQSRRLDRYRETAGGLLASGHAYRCFCSPEELEKRREEAQARGETFRYDGRCRHLSPVEVEDRLHRGIVPAVRVRMPPGTSAWADLVRGTIAVEHSQLDDFVILKSDGMPTYHFAVVVDDMDMAITHVIRGEDHISNTPKQMVLYEALGARMPVFAHIPLIHGPDGGRLSKRHGAAAVLEYRRAGYLPEAVVNFLALLGWSPGDDREIMDVTEMAAAFDLGRVVKTPAVFNLEKLTWMNGLYLARVSLAHKTNLLIPYWIEAGYLRAGDDSRMREWLEEVVRVVGERIKLLADIVPQTAFLFLEDVEPDEKAAKLLEKAAADREVFRRVVAELEPVPRFERAVVEGIIRKIVENSGLAAGKVMQPLRAAITGSTASPGLFECFELVGKERGLARIRKRLLSSPPGGVAQVEGG